MEENAIADLVKQLETEYERAVVETEQEYTIKLVRAQGFKAFAKWYGILLISIIDALSSAILNLSRPRLVAIRDQTCIYSIISIVIY